MGLRDSVTVSVVVVGGVGSANLTTDAWAESVGINSPDNTPNFDLEITNAAGQLLLNVQDIDTDPCTIVQKIKLQGVTTISIMNAADDGTYAVELFLL